VINTTNIKTIDGADVYIEKILRDGKKKFGIINSIELRKILDSKQGNEELERIKKLYVEDTIGINDFEKLYGMLGQGYLAMSCIHHFHVDESETTDFVMVPGKKTMETATEVTHTARSTMSGKFTIFDLETGKAVFTADHEVTDINTTSHTERGCMEGCIASLIYQMMPVKVTGPCEMAEKLFEQIIANIPKK
jgi:hypothetical protein